MNIPVIEAVTGVFKSLFGVVDQLVEDKDKKNELIFKMAEMQNQLSIQLLQQNTVPWVDATVKMMFAVRDVVIPFLRPVGSALLTGVAAYLEATGKPLSPALSAIMGSAFPGWMASRYSEKKAGKQ